MTNTAFSSGEEVAYDLYFDWGIIWKKVGYASMKTEFTKSKAAYDISLLAVTNKTADKLFKMRDTLTCRLSETLEPLYYRKAAEEGSRYSVDEAWYSYQDGVAHVNQVRKRPDRDPVETSHSDKRCIYDMLSIIAVARNFDLSSLQKGHKTVLPMATGRRIEDLTLTFLGNEKIKAKDGNAYRCKGFSIITKDKDGDDEEMLRFYVTDDKNHLPVRIDFNMKIGSAKAFLKRVSGNMFQFSSIVEK